MELTGVAGSGYGVAGSGYGVAGFGSSSCFVKKSPNCYMKSMELTGAVSSGHGAVSSDSTCQLLVVCEKNLKLRKCANF